MNKERCPNCRGTGKWFEKIPGRSIPTVRQHQCPMCEGTGKVLVPESPEEEKANTEGGKA